jgi:Domain of unknown function (DUF3331)
MPCAGFFEGKLKMDRADHWIGIVGGLGGGAAHGWRASLQCLAYGCRECGAHPASAVPRGSNISNIERQTASTILVSWSDATRGRYSDQVWRTGYARAAGTCGLTGGPVRRGDMVFRPALRGGVAPVNALDMILADHVPRE